MSLRTDLHRALRHRAIAAPLSVLRPPTPSASFCLLLPGDLLGLLLLNFSPLVLLVLDHLVLVFLPLFWSSCNWFFSLQSSCCWSYCPCRGPPAPLGF